jgi:hypothetical protein
MARGVEFTEPALLAGLWVLLAMQEALRRHSARELEQFAGLALAGIQAPDSG